MVVPISEASLEYAQQVRLQLRKAKLHVDVDATDRKMQKKVREAQLAQYNYILVRPGLLPSAQHCHAICPPHCITGLSPSTAREGKSRNVVFTKLTAMLCRLSDCKHP